MTGLKETASSEDKGKTELCIDILGTVASSGATEDLVASSRDESCQVGDSLHVISEVRQELRAHQVAAWAPVLMPCTHETLTQFMVLALAVDPRMILAFHGWDSCRFRKPPLLGAILHCFEPDFHTKRRC
jgi:hypothetical protein